MQDGEVIPVIQATLHTVEPVKTVTTKPDAEGKTNTFQAQSFLLEAPSGKIWCSTIHKEQFIGQEMTGVMVKLVSTQGDKGLRGITKVSYQSKDPQSDRMITRSKLRLDHGAIISRVEVQPPPKPQAPTDPVLSIAREMRYCWDTIKKVAPAEFTLEMTKDWSTSLFIECQRKGIKFPIVAASTPVPEQKEPASPPQGQPATETAAPQPAQPKLTKEQLGTKIISEVKITPSMLAGHDLEKVFDLCYAEAKHEVPVEFLDAAFDAAKKRHKEETKLYTAILQNWKLFVGDAKKLQQVKKDEAAVEEMDITPPFE